MQENRKQPFPEGEREDATRTYFRLQAYWGITEHMGGNRATRQLIEWCGLREAARVLEVGCGVGITSCRLARAQGCRVVAVDYCEGMVENAGTRVMRQRVDDRVSLAVADAAALPFRDPAFDAVIAESVTSFLADKARGLGEFARVTRPGGRVGINELTWLEGRRPDVAEYLQQSMGAEALEGAEWHALLRGAGLEMIHSSVERLRPIDQVVSEISRHGLIGLSRAAGRGLTLYLRSPAFRKHVSRLKRAPSRFFAGLGYGIYVARKPEE